MFTIRVIVRQRLRIIKTEHYIDLIHHAVISDKVVLIDSYGQIPAGLEEYLIERDTVYIHSPVSELFRLFEAVREHRLDLVAESCIKRRIRHLCRRFGLEYHDEIALAVGRVM